MKKRIIILAAALLSLPVFMPELSAQTAPRKKVAVVLSGGGAKGMVHIGVLRVLEKAGIPVDIITGTSMGSLVGGLYAIGYDANSLDSLVHEQDWGFLLSDKTAMSHQTLEDRKKQNTYFLSREISPKGRNLSETGGFIQGRNLSALFAKLTEGYRDSTDFDSLPIPFACVATDIVDYSEVVMRSGVLAEAMRSSMSIPGVFSPIRQGDKILVDGGLRNNFPVDVAREMGADIVIGVTMPSEPKTADDLENGASVIGQIIDLNCKNKFDENCAKTDILIKCDTKGYTAASFSNKAIDTLVARGEAAAMKHWDELVALRRQLGLPEGYHQKRAKPYYIEGLPETLPLHSVVFTDMQPRDADYLRRKFHLDSRKSLKVEDIDDIISSVRLDLFYGDADYYVKRADTPDNTYDVEIVARNKKRSQLNFGVRFDTEEMVALQANANVQSRTKVPMDADFTLRLGKRIMARGQLNMTPWTFGRMSASYTFRRNDINLYEHGDRASNVTYNQHTLDVIPFDFYIKNFNFKLGARFDFYNFSDLLVGEPGLLDGVRLEHENLISYHSDVTYNSENKWNFPTRGANFHAGYRYVTSNFYNYRHHNGFNIVDASWRMNFRLAHKLTFQPMAYGRLVMGHTLETQPDGMQSNVTPYALRNVVGGDFFGHYLEWQQMPFPGVGYIEQVDDKFVALQLRLQQQIADNNFILLKVASYAAADEYGKLFEHSPKLGVQVAYYYNLGFFGPLGASFGWSTKTHEPCFYLNLGYEF